MLKKIILSAGLLLLVDVAAAASTHALFFKPAGACMQQIGSTLSSLQSSLALAASGGTTLTVDPQTLLGPLAEVSVSMQLAQPPTTAYDYWQVSGMVSDKACGVITRASVTCYLMDTCLNRIGPDSTYSCHSGGWTGMDELTILTCNIKLPVVNATTLDAQDFSAICTALSPHMIQDKVLFDVVSADGSQECDIFW